MSKCPLCGSDGDDLVFRFYCSNSGCRNYVPNGGLSKPYAKVSKWTNQRLHAPLETYPGAPKTWRQEVVGEFADGKEELGKQIVNALLNPRDFRSEYLGEPFPRDPWKNLRLPKFEVQQTTYGYTYVTWREEIVPQILRQIVNHVVEYTHTSGNKKDAARRLVKDHLTRLVLNGELVWSDELERWELHSVEY